MNKILLLSLIFIVSCSSSQKVKNLEDKVEQLTNLLEKKGGIKSEEKEIQIESPTISLKLPESKNKQPSSIKNKIPLGQKDNIEFTLLFDNSSYWIIAKPLNPNTLIEGTMIMNVIHSDKSPESFTFFSIDDGVYKSFGDNIKGNVEIEIIFARDNHSLIIFNIEATI